MECLEYHLTYHFHEEDLKGQNLKVQSVKRFEILLLHAVVYFIQLFSCTALRQICSYMFDQSFSFQRYPSQVLNC
jgi:hypothetical protein